MIRLRWVFTELRLRCGWGDVVGVSIKWLIGGTQTNMIWDASQWHDTPVLRTHSRVCSFQCCSESSPGDCFEDKNSDEILNEWNSGDEAQGGSQDACTMQGVKHTGQIGARRIDVSGHVSGSAHDSRCYCTTVGFANGIVSRSSWCNVCYNLNVCRYVSAGFTHNSLQLKSLFSWQISQKQRPAGTT